MAFWNRNKQQEQPELTDAQRAELHKQRGDHWFEENKKNATGKATFGILFAGALTVIVIQNIDHISDFFDSAEDLKDHILDYFKNGGDPESLPGEIQGVVEQVENNEIEDPIVNEADVQDEVLAENAGSGNETVVEEEGASVDPEISPEIAQMMNELGIPDHLADHIVEIDGHTYILENPSDPTSKIAEIKELSDVDGGAWARNNIAGFDDRTYILATIGENKPFATAHALEAIGYNPIGKGDAIAYTNHVSDNYDAQGNRRADCWQNNQIQMLEYGNWSCGTSVADPVCIPEADAGHVQEIVEPPINYEDCVVRGTGPDAYIEHVVVTDANGTVVHRGDPQWLLDHPDVMQENNIIYRDGHFIDMNEVEAQKAGHFDPYRPDVWIGENPPHNPGHFYHQISERHLADGSTVPVYREFELYREIQTNHGPATLNRETGTVDGPRGLRGVDVNGDGVYDRIERDPNYSNRPNGEHRGERHGSHDRHSYRDPSRYDHHDYRQYSRTEYETNPYQRGQYYSGYGHSNQPARFHPGHNFPQPHGNGGSIHFRNGQLTGIEMFLDKFGVRIGRH